MNRRYFSPKGRLARSHYWVYYLVPLYIAGWFVGGDLVESGGIITWMIAALLSWLAFAGMVKRLHDLDYSLWLLMGAAACAGAGVWLAGFSETLGWVVGGLGGLVVGWLQLLMYFGRGTKGDNRFGADPLEGTKGW